MHKKWNSTERSIGLANMAVGSVLLQSRASGGGEAIFSELHVTLETLTTYTHSSLCIHARKPYPRIIFENCAGKYSRLTKSPHAPRYRRERRLPLKAQRR
jgi:hypothetical protein